MDHERLVSELVRALRGRRSQPALSRRLGYDSNVVYAWESGRRMPSASVFFTLAEKSRIEVAARVRGFVGSSWEPDVDLTKRVGVSALLRTLGRGRSAIELARATGTDRTTVSRWLHGESEPRAPELFAFVGATSSRLLEFVALFVDPEQVASTRSAYRDLLVQRELAYELPWSHAVLRALELASYRALPQHVPGFVAAQVGISLEDEARYLAALSAGKQIRKRRGRYVVQRVLTVDTRPNEEDNRRLKRHWAGVSLDRFERAETSHDTLFSFNLFAIDAQNYERIHALHLEYYQRVREIVAAAKDPERVVLLNMQLMPLSGRRSTEGAGIAEGFGKSPRYTRS